MRRRNLQELIFDEVQVYLHTVAAAEEGLSGSFAEKGGVEAAFE